MKLLKQLLQRIGIVAPSSCSSPPHLATMLEQAVTLQVLGDYTSAIKVCDQILTVTPLSRTAYQIRGIANLGLKNYQGADADFYIAQSLEDESGSDRPKVI